MMQVKIVPGEDEERDLGRVGLDGGREEARDEEGAKRSDGRRPAEHRRREGLVKDDGDLAKGRSITNASAVEENEEADEESGKVRHAVRLSLACKENDDAEDGAADGHQDSVVVRDARAAELVRHHAADGTNQGANEGAEEGGREAAHWPAGERAVARLELALVLQLGAFVGAVLVEDVEDELGERRREANEASESHDVQVCHPVVVLVLEDGDLCAQSGLGRRRGEEPDEDVLDEADRDDDGDRDWDGLAWLRVVTAGVDDGDADARSNVRGALKRPVATEHLDPAVGHGVHRLGQVVHPQEGRDCAGDADGEEEPAEVHRPVAADVPCVGAKHQEHVRAKQLHKRDTQISEAAVHAESITCLAPWEEGVDVGHR
eukprot:CAMPEP_0119355676 /NCGR_PEP_ID=MMETSP1334-20130426/4480_1 /TAXON_ID=127549 /ORGANISM="Calcidiscus leptoporus, Strain RCC1130" /LENGTH=375 /DNA_ID=CAMNT_0007369561 /DNA_START=246 /DNA_END=1368 /DNA_ORIENTATION=-